MMDLVQVPALRVSSRVLKLQTYSGGVLLPRASYVYFPVNFERGSPHRRYSPNRAALISDQREGTPDCCVGQRSTVSKLCNIYGCVA